MNRASKSKTLDRWVTTTAIVVVITAGIVVTRIWIRPATADEALKQGHYELAMQYLLKESDAGDPAAQNKIGNLYALGLGVERNRQIAVDWYHKAAFAGNSEARVNIGHLFNHGFTLDGKGPAADLRSPDTALAYAWFNLARNAGHQQAQLYMSELLHESRLTYHSVNQIRRDFATIEAFRDLRKPSVSP